MPRNEIKIMSGWKFAQGDVLPGNEKFNSVYLPHDWAVYAPVNKDMAEGEAQGFFDRWGVGWYKKELCLSEKKANYKYFLEFGGVFENSTIWVNGEKAGENKYGYSSFETDITEFVKEGENEILVRVDNTSHPADRWYSGCGIYRTVKLLETEEKHFDLREISVNTKAEGAEVFVKTGTGEKTFATLFDEDGNEAAKGEGRGEITLVVQNAKLWLAERPYLYTLELNMFCGERICDTVRIKTGIRDIEFVSDDKRCGFYVNGKREILKGVCIHQDISCRGTAAKKELWRERLLNLKEMGCNAIRPSHHVFSSEFLDLCDELGFYVYDECFDKWVHASYARYFEKEWKKDIDAMVKRDRNHPSVIIWGVGNEATNQGSSSMISILEELVGYVKKIDTSRPVTYAMKPAFLNDADGGALVATKGIRQGIGYIEKIGSICDIICCNYMDMWYDEIHKALPHKLILGTEVFQYFSGSGDTVSNFTEKMPSLVPFEKEYCIGSMIWTGIDYLGESIGYPFKGRGGAPIKTNGERRPMYYVFKSLWSKRAVLHFSVVDYTAPDEGTKYHWSAPPFASHWEFDNYNMMVVPYMIATNCDEVKLFTGERKITPPSPENGMIQGLIPYVPGFVEAVGFINGEEVIRHKIVTPKKAIKLKFCKEDTEILPEEGYEKLFTVGAFDEDNNPVFRENSLVKFKIEGDAEIIGVDNGDLSTEEKYISDEIHLHQGKASVMVRFFGKGNGVRLSAQSEKLSGTELDII